MNLMGQVMSIEQLRVLGESIDTPEDACWSWPGLKPGRRKQLVWTSPVTGVRRTRYVHVIAFVLDTGVDPEQSREFPFVCHTCDNEWCFNPRHLYQGNYHTNNQDSMARGRRNPVPRKAIAASIKSRVERTHCKRNHELNEKNTYVTRQGFRQCRLCQVIRGRKYRQRKTNIRS